MISKQWINQEVNDIVCLQSSVAPSSQRLAYSILGFNWIGKCRRQRDDGLGCTGRRLRCSSNVAWWRTFRVAPGVTAGRLATNTGGLHHSNLLNTPLVGCKKFTIYQIIPKSPSFPAIEAETISESINYCSQMFFMILRWLNHTSYHMLQAIHHMLWAV